MRSHDQTGLARRAMEKLNELGLTPITAATRNGHHRDYFRNSFRTGSYPRADTLASLATALGVSADWLLFGEDTPESTSRPSGRVRSSESACVEGVSIVSTPSGRVRLTLNTDVSMGVAAQILALIEGDKA